MVTATGSGQEASELGAQGDFDILLTDLGLPDIPGDMVIRDVLAAARRRPWVVVVTGYEEPFARRPARPAPTSSSPSPSPGRRFSIGWYRPRPSPPSRRRDRL